MVNGKDLQKCRMPLLTNIKYNKFVWLKSKRLIHSITIVGIIITNKMKTRPPLFHKKIYLPLNERVCLTRKDAEKQLSTCNKNGTKSMCRFICLKNNHVKKRKCLQ